jgi:serine/threonine protein kinase
MPWPRFLERVISRFRRGPGRTIVSKGNYRFLRVLGKGGMGEVWLAEKAGLAGFSKLVAVKLILTEKLRDQRTLEMFTDEARLVANLIHPNIVQVFQLGRTRREHFIVMEHVFGTSVLQLMERVQAKGERIPIDITLYIVARILHGLHYAHNKHTRYGEHVGIVHRDICPSNILVSFRGIPKLTDFGVAKATTSRVDDEGNIIWGKFPYMAPEAVHRRGTSPRSDIYAVGLVLREMLTGELAHNVGSTRALKTLLDKESEAERRASLPEDLVPEPLAQIVLKALQHDPEARHNDAREFAREIEQFLLLNFLFPDEDRVSAFLADHFPDARKHRWW